MDKLQGADLVCDFDSGILPFTDDCCGDLYTAHCLEHVLPVHEIVGEILRICRVGAKVEIRVPHWLHPMASCPGHHHVLSDRQIKIWVNQPQAHPFPQGKAFRLLGIHYQPDIVADAFFQAFPNLHRQFILEHMPGCSYEIRATLEVVSR